MVQYVIVYDIYIIFVGITICMMAVDQIFLMREIKFIFISPIYKTQHCVLSKLHPRCF